MGDRTQLKSVVMDQYGNKVISQHRYGMMVYRAAIVEGDGDKSMGFIPTAEVFLDDRDVKVLKDTLNKWYPPTHDELLQMLADYHGVSKDDIMIDLGGGDNGTKD